MFDRIIFAQFHGILAYLDEIIDDGHGHPAPLPGELEGDNVVSTARLKPNIHARSLPGRFSLVELQHIVRTHLLSVLPYWGGENGFDEPTDNHRVIFPDLREVCRDRHTDFGQEFQNVRGILTIEQPHFLVNEVVLIFTVVFALDLDNTRDWDQFRVPRAHLGHGAVLFDDGICDRRLGTIAVNTTDNNTDNGLHVLLIDELDELCPCERYRRFIRPILHQTFNILSNQGDGVAAELLNGFPLSRIFQLLCNGCNSSLNFCRHTTFSQLFFFHC